MCRDAQMEVCSSTFFCYEQENAPKWFCNILKTSHLTDLFSNPLL